PKERSGHVLAEYFEDPLQCDLRLTELTPVLHDIVKQRLSAEVHELGAFVRSDDIPEYGVHRSNRVNDGGSRSNGFVGNLPGLSRERVYRHLKTLLEKIQLRFRNCAVVRRFERGFVLFLNDGTERIGRAMKLARERGLLSPFVEKSLRRAEPVNL